MSDKLFDIPAIAQSVDPAIRNPFTRMREALQTLLGVIGDGSNAAYTARRIGSELSSGSGLFGGGAVGGGVEPDLTPPPTVTNFRATAGFSQVIVQWDAAIYTQGHGPKQTNIYGIKRPNPDPGPAPTFGDAQLVDSAIDALNIDSIPSELNTVWHLWAKFETVDGVESIAPAGGVNGVIVTTGQDIAQLLQVLTGKITASQLYSALGSRIDMIDGSAATPGTVNYRDAAVYNSAAAYVVSYTYTKATIDGSIASAVTAVQATLNGNIAAAVQTEATARANADGTLFAQYTVKLDVNGYVSGFGLASTGGSAAPTSSFIIRADSFAIASPSGPGVAPATPFIVRTTATTENGVSIPAGVYMDAAYIVNVNALYGRFGTLVADSVATTQLNAARLTLGDGTVGGNLKSANYSGGAAGWIIRPDGYAEFSTVVVRGTIFANAGTIAGITIGAADIRTTNYVPGSTGTRFNASGSLEVNNLQARGFVAGGAYTGYAWPAAGAGGGFYLGPQGLLLGSANDGRYFQVESNGDIHAPGFSIVGGVATFSGALSAASGSFGTVVIATGGSLSSGQSGYNSGTGFWLGLSGGVPKFSIGNSAGSNLRWDGSDLSISNVKYVDQFLTSIPGGDLVVSVSYGYQTYGSRTVAVSGGRPPYSYIWIGATSNNGGQSVTIGGSGDGQTVYLRTICIVSDSNGRVAVTSFDTTATHAASPPPSPGGGDGGG